jgi:glycosyltransferase involved in cell wall biosynthesis
MSLVAALRPKVLVELGTHAGDSYCALCQAVLEHNLSTRCYAFGTTWSGDGLPHKCGSSVLEDLRAHHDPLYGRFSCLRESARVDDTSSFADGSVDLLHIDGMHISEKVPGELSAWLPKLSEHAVVLLHATGDGDGGSRVARLWKELSGRHRSFEFEHGHGLGIVSVGAKPPEALLPLFDVTEEERAAIRTFFRDLGLRGARENEQRSTAEHYIQRQARVEEQLARVERATEAVDLDLSELKAQLAQLRSGVQMAAQQAQGWGKRIRRLEEGVAFVTRAASDRLLALEAGSLLQRGVRQARSSLLRTVFELQPRSDQHVRSVDDQLEEWEATGGDPCFRLLSDRSRFPSGWALLDFAFDSEVRDHSTLYLDTGIGYSEHHAIRLPAPVEGHIRALVCLPLRIRAMRLDPVERLGRFRLGALTVQEIGSVEAVLRLAAPIGKEVVRKPERIPRTFWNAIKLFRSAGMRGVKEKLANRGRRPASLDYERWVDQFDSLDDEARSAIRQRIASLPCKPLLSVVMPTYETPEKWLRRAVESIQGQLYDNWELCIADDASRSRNVRATLEELSREDPRIRVKFRAENGHISAASNSALELVRGDFVVLLDHDDELPEQALYRVVEELNAHPDAGIVYSDEDKIDEDSQRFDPYFKPDWNPDLFYSHNLISHLGVYRTSLVREVGGFRKGFEGGQDYDLALRIIERVRPDQIRHIPHVLYHWRAIRGSTALSADQKSYAELAARKAIQDHFDRTGVDAVMEPGPAPGLHRAHYRLPAAPPLVSIIIPTRNGLRFLRRCVDSLRWKTSYRRYEIIIVDNQSDDRDTLKYLRNLEAERAARVIPYPHPFNYSAINNLAAREAKGALLAFLNNDLEVIAPDWLEEMVSHALRPEVGAVGARLLYANGTVQHAGIFLGIGPDRVAGTPHRGIPRDSFGYFGRAHVLQAFSAVTAACMVTRRAVFEEVGGFDQQHLPVAYNDIDLCLRIRERGHRVVWTPYAELYHFESASRGSDLAPEKRDRFQREAQYMKERWGELLLNDPFNSPNHSLDSDVFELAWPPRGVRPWEQPQG